jgi:hypothetical protein
MMQESRGQYRGFSVIGLARGPTLPTVSQAELRRRGPPHDPSFTLRTATPGLCPSVRTARKAYSLSALRYGGISSIARGTS